MNFITIFVLLSLVSLSFCDEHSIIELPRNVEHLNEEVRSRCSSWRVGVEANNVSPWKTIPEDCVGYVKEYMLSPSYENDLEFVSE